MQVDKPEQRIVELKPGAEAERRPILALGRPKQHPVRRAESFDHVPV